MSAAQVLESWVTATEARRHLRFSENGAALRCFSAPIFDPANVGNPLSSQQFAYVWEYTIDSSMRDEFLSAYASEGEWAKLMSRHPGYVGTSLFHDADNDNRYVTVDYWLSKSDRDSFRNSFSAEYDHLDQKCERFTAAEVFIGDFFVVGSSDS